jgi:hypothetical protein
MEKPTLLVFVLLSEKTFNCDKILCEHVLDKPWADENYGRYEPVHIKAGSHASPTLQTEVWKIATEERDMIDMMVLIFNSSSRG